MRIKRDDIPGAIDRILETSFWLPAVETMKPYERLHDEHGGTYEGTLKVMLASNGDVCVWIEDQKRKSKVLVFRMSGQGGGLNTRTRAALVVLAYAMRRDGEEPLH